MRSGTQFELKLKLSERATTGLLREIVDELLEFDVQIQGSQTIPVPTLVFSITPAKQARSGFIRRRIGRNKATQRKPKPLPKSDIKAEVVVQPTQSFVPPTPAPSTTAATGTSQAEQRLPGPLAQAAKTTGRATLRIISVEISQAFSIIGNVVKRIAIFFSEWLTKGALQATRPFAGWFPKIPGAITKTSLLMTMSVNSLFGAGESRNPDENTDTTKKNAINAEKAEKSDSSNG